jgi:hypothetical protein
MKVIAERFWTEPAAAIGLLTSIALLILALATGADLTADTIVAIVAPVASALGIRQVVSPAAGPRPVAVEQVLDRSEIQRAASEDRPRASD